MMLKSKMKRCRAKHERHALRGLAGFGIAGVEICIRGVRRSETCISGFRSSCDTISCADKAYDDKGKAAHDQSAMKRGGEKKPASSNRKDTCVVAALSKDSSKQPGAEGHSAESGPLKRSSWGEWSPMRRKTKTGGGYDGDHQNRGTECSRCNQRMKSTAATKCRSQCGKQQMANFPGNKCEESR